MTDKKLILKLKQDILRKDEKINQLKTYLVDTRKYYINEIIIKDSTIQQLYAESKQFRKPVRPVLLEFAMD